MSKPKIDINFHSPVSCISTEANKTGSWRYLTPEVEIKASPCEAACPLAIPISDFINEIEKDNLMEARKLIMMENPIPSVCGRVCIHPCEDMCSRGGYDRSIAIHMLERYAGDNFSLPDIEVDKKTGKNIAVVGAGPAGLAAAYFLLLMGHDVTMFDANDEPGGILKYIIPEYRLPGDILKKAVQAVMDLKPEFKKGMTLGGNLTFSDLESFDKVFLGTGAWAGNRLSAGSESTDLVSGMEILKLIDKGDYAGIGSSILIIGGGNTAIDVARSLLRLGRKPVILYRRDIDDMPAFKQEVREAIREGVEIRTGVIMKEIIKDENDIVGAGCVRVEFQRDNPKKRNEFMEIKGSEFYLDADQIVSAIGEVPDTSILDKGININDNKVAVDGYGKTNIPKYFAGGDLIKQPHLVVYALASGKRAAISIDAELRGLRTDDIFPSITVGARSISFKRYRELKQKLLNDENVQMPGPVRALNPDTINLNYFEPRDRLRERKLPISRRRSSFEEVHIGYNQLNAVTEGGRCFHCGKCILCDNCIIFCPDISIRANTDNKNVEIDLDYCKGCGLCAEECPRGVITMHREVKK